MRPIESCRIHRDTMALYKLARIGSAGGKNNSIHLADGIQAGAGTQGNAVDCPHTATLSGAGTGSEVSLSSSTVTFADQIQTTTGDPKTITLTIRLCQFLHPRRIWDSDILRNNPDFIMVPLRVCHLAKKNGSGLENSIRSRFAGLARPLKEQFHAQLYRAIPFRPMDRLAGLPIGRCPTAAEVTRWRGIYFAKSI